MDAAAPGRSSGRSRQDPAETCRRRVAHQLHAVVTGQRSFRRRFRAWETLGLVNLKLLFAGIAQLPFTPGRRRAFKKDFLLTADGWVGADIDDLSDPDRPVRRIRVLDLTRNVGKGPHRRRRRPQPQPGEVAATEEVATATSMGTPKALSRNAVKL